MGTSRPEPVRVPKSTTITCTVTLTAAEFGRLDKITRQLFGKAPAEYLNPYLSARVQTLLADHTIAW